MSLIPLIPDFLVTIPAAFLIGKAIGKHAKKRF